MRSGFRVVRWAVAGIAMLGACLGMRAQTTADEVLTRLKDKPLFLKGYWGENKLSFDADGRPAKKYEWVSFTQAGMDVTSVKMQGDVLHIEGQRAGLEFSSPDIPRRVRVGGKIMIDIGGGAGTDYGKALDQIFAPDLASLTPSLPLYWRGYAMKHFLPAESVPVPDKPSVPTSAVSGEQKTEDPLHIAGTVKPPRVLASVEPSYTDAAREARLAGTVQVYLWVAEDGRSSHLKISKPIGLGLDEAALWAITQYKFAPAMQNGKPVKVDLYINVNFQMR